MRILMAVHHELTADAGAPGVTMRLASEFQEAGADVRLLSHSDLSASMSRVTKSLVFPFLVARASIRMARQNDGLDVIDCSTGDIWPAALLRRLIPRVLLVTRSHGLEHAVHDQALEQAKGGVTTLSWRYPIYHGGFRLWEVKKSLQMSDVCLVLNSSDRDMAVHRLGVESHRVNVVINGVSQVFLGRPAKKTLSQSHLNIAVVGSYLSRKGVEHIERALNGSLLENPNWHITFLGTGLTEPEILSRYIGATHGQLTVVPQFRNQDLPELLDPQDILLFPSLFEGQPIALLEGMACGLAPIVSGIPSLLEVAVHEQNCLVVPPADPDAIVEALTRLDRDRALMTRIASTAQEAAQRHDWRLIAQNQLALFARALEAKDLHTRRG